MNGRIPVFLHADACPLVIQRRRKLPSRRIRAVVIKLAPVGAASRYRCATSRRYRRTVIGARNSSCSRQTLNVCLAEFLIKVWVVSSPNERAPRCDVGRGFASGRIWIQDVEHVASRRITVGCIGRRVVGKFWPKVTINGMNAIADLLRRRKCGITCYLRIAVVHTDQRF